MPNTYFDSELTGAQIEAALNAIHGVVTPENNGLVLAIEDGLITAKSVTELEGSTLIEKTITENGTYDPADDDADGYSEVTVNVSGGGSGTIEALSVTANGTYTASGDVDGYSPVTVNVPTSAHIYGDTYDPDYYMDSASLICTLSERTYYKTTADPAYVAYAYRSSGYTGPILVSETAEAVQFTSDSTTYSYAGTIAHNGTTYYYSSEGYSQAGNFTSLGGFAQKLAGTYATAEAAAQALLALAVFDTPHVDITANGEYPVPSGYDGYGDLTVAVQPNVGTKTITANGIYNASDDSLDGYSQITVNVSGGGAAFIEDEYSQYLTSVFNTGIDMNTDYTVEVAFYANAYQDDGHIVGQNYTSDGRYFHLTTFSNKWYVGSSGTEANFSADSTNYPLYGADIVFSAKTGDFSMNGTTTIISLTMATRSGYQYCLNTRGGSTSTSGIYKYKYVKIYDADSNLICHWVFGYITLGETTIYLARDYVSDTYKPYV